MGMAAPANPSSLNNPAYQLATYPAAQVRVYGIEVVYA